MYAYEWSICMNACVTEQGIYLHDRTGHQTEEGMRSHKMVVSHHMVTGNWSQDPWKSSSYLISLLSSPLYLTLLKDFIFNYVSTVYPCTCARKCQRCPEEGIRLPPGASIAGGHEWSKVGGRNQALIFARTLEIIFSFLCIYFLR